MAALPSAAPAAPGLAGSASLAVASSVMASEAVRLLLLLLLAMGMGMGASNALPPVLRSLLRTWQPTVDTHHVPRPTFRRWVVVGCCKSLTA
jgi:hypothetical protein